MPANSGRQSVARKILLDASQRAMETGEYSISFRCRNRQEAFNIRQSCYAYQRTWAGEIQAQAIEDGKEPSVVLNETLMKAAWPSASIRYERVGADHWLIIEFKRIPTDPSWDEMIKDRMINGLPPRLPRTKLRGDEIMKLIGDSNE